TQHRNRSAGDPEVPQQTGAAQAIPDPTDHLTQAARFPRAGGRDVWQAFGKDLPTARAIATAKAPGSEPTLHLPPWLWQSRSQRSHRLWYSTRDSWRTRDRVAAPCC